MINFKDLHEKNRVEKVVNRSRVLIDFEHRGYSLKDKGALSQTEIMTARRNFRAKRVEWYGERGRWSSLDESQGLSRKRSR